MVIPSDSLLNRVVEIYFVGYEQFESGRGLIELVQKMLV